MSRKPDQHRKLGIKRETLRTLATRDLVRVAGGSGGGVDPDPSGACGWVDSATMSLGSRLC
jgi:hypothetical protein